MSKASLFLTGLALGAISITVKTELSAKKIQNNIFSEAKNQIIQLGKPITTSSTQVAPLPDGAELHQNCVDTTYILLPYKKVQALSFN